MFQSTQTTTIGYKLVQKSPLLWQIVTPKGVFSGNLRQVCTYAVQEHGFSIKELEIGVGEMEKNFHNAAEYGIFKSFIFSYDFDEKTAIKH